MLTGFLVIRENRIAEKCKLVSAIFCPFLIFLMGMAMPRNLEAEEAGPLRLIQTIPLRNVEGRIDHMAVDLKGERLFIAALGNNTVEIVDLRAGKHMETITGLHEPQGVGFVPEFNKIFVANAQSGACEVFDGSSFKRIKSIKLSDDADNIRYDAAARRVYVGYGSGGLGIIDAATGDQLGEIKLDGHPESFQLEKSGPRIFVNIPTSQKIAVVDREKRAALRHGQSGALRPISQWHLTKRIIGCLSAFENPRNLLSSTQSQAKWWPIWTAPVTLMIFFTTVQGSEFTFPVERASSALFNSRMPITINH